MEITLEEIKRKFESLPEDIKWAIMAANVDDKIIEIGQARGLNVEQMGQLSLETHMVMFGFIHPDKFEESLKGSLKLSDDINKAIVIDVNEKILKSIREKLMSLYSNKEETVLKDKPETEIPQNNSENPNNDILKSAGIEIMPEELKSGSGVPIKPVTQSISAAKLSEQPFKIPAATTIYTLNNISKPSDAIGNIPQGNVAQKTTPSVQVPQKPTTPGVDPYRMPI